MENLGKTEASELKLATELMELLEIKTTHAGLFMAEFTFEGRNIKLFSHNPQHMNGMMGSVIVRGPSLTSAGNLDSQNSPLVYHLWTNHLPTWNTKERLDSINRKNLMAEDEQVLEEQDINSLREALARMEPQKD